MYPKSNEVALLEQLETERAISDLVGIALELWLPLAEDSVLRAAAEPPPDPAAAADKEAQWDYLVDALILYGIGIVAADAFDKAYRALTGVQLAAGRTAVPLLKFDMPGMPTTTDLRSRASTVLRRRLRIDADVVYARANSVPQIQEFVNEHLTAIRGRVIDAVGRVFRRTQRITAEAPAADARTEVQPVFDPLDPEWVSAADQVGQTHATGALNAASEGAARQSVSDSGRQLQIEWVAILDTHTREGHREANGQRQPPGSPFQVDGEPLRFPGDPMGSIDNTISCVVGSTQVRWPGQLVSEVTRRSYTGTFIHLRTGDGHELTITPNHPVLTPTGYVPAGRLCPGDYVMATGDIGLPEIDHVPPVIEQVYRSSRDSGIEEWIGARAVDFHGDVSEDDKVSVVRPDSYLGDGGDPTLDGDIREQQLIGLLDGKRSATGPCHATSSHSVADFRARSVTAGRFVSSSGVTPSLLRSHPRHTEQIRLTAGSDTQVQFAQTGGDGVSADAEVLGYPKDTDAIRVHAREFFGVDVFQNPTAIKLPQSGVDDTDLDAEVLRHLTHMRPFGMQPTQLVDVDRYTATHDVFNLSTTEEYYIGNGIAVHNCRCRLFAFFIDNPVLTASSHGSATMSTEEGTTMPQYRSFTSVLAVINTPTDDGRMFASDIDLSFRDFPLPLLWQKQSAGGHFDAFTVGVIQSAGVVGNEVIGKGYLLNTIEADESALQIEHGVTGPSVDLGDVEWELRDKNGNQISEEDWWDNPDMEVVQTVLSARVLAATLVATPAFGQTSIALGDTIEIGEDALVAAGALSNPGSIDTPVYPASFFENPEFSTPTLPHITDEGRIQGHLAAFDVCHIGIQDSCVIAPRSQTEYAWFHTAPPVKTESGKIKVGRLTVGGGHAGPRMGPAPAIAHYDNAGTCFALVHVGEDEHGIWFSGVPAPGVTPEQITAGLAAPLSGDWRNVGGNLELVAALAVNTPGFPIIASGATDIHDEPMALVASLGPCATSETSYGLPQVAAQVDEMSLARHIVSEWRAAEKREDDAKSLVTGEVRRQASALIEKVK